MPHQGREVRVAAIRDLSHQSQLERENRALKATMKRDELDYSRYMKIYQIDTGQYEFADLVIDTEKVDQFEESKAIVSALTAKMS